MIAKRVSRRQFFAFTSLSNHLTSLERWPTGTLIEASVAMPILDRSRFLRILNLTDSPNDSEALSAVRRANALLHASNSPSHSPSRCDLRHRSLPTPSYKRFSIDADCATDADCRAKNWRPGRTSRAVDRLRLAQIPSAARRRDRSSAHHCRNDRHLMRTSAAEGTWAIAVGGGGTSNFLRRSRASIAAIPS